MSSKTPTPPERSDEAEALLRRKLPDSEDDIEAKLSLADLRRRFTGATVEPLTLGRWEIERLLGRGGMGSVYLARNTKLDRKVALKVLGAFPDAQRSTMNERLRREALALAQIHHPNVVQVHDVDDIDESGRTVIEMEYVEGATLRQWQQRPQPWRRVVEVYAQAGDGLAAIHAAELLHRDIKPDNLLLTAKGLVKIVDFGLAIAPQPSISEPSDPRPRSSSRLGARLTRASSMVGTPQYMAPERFGHGELTAASDQFSLAAALYEALYATLPFAVEGADEAERVERYVAATREGRLTIVEPPPTLPRWLIRALERALSFDPHARHRSVAALVAELRRGLRRQRRWLLGGTFTLASVALTTLGWNIRQPPCASLERELAADSTTDPLGPLRARVQEADAPHLDRGLVALDDTRSRQRQQSSESRLAVCEARSRHESSPATLDRREACLDEVRDETDARLRDLVASTDDLAGRTVEAIKWLERVNTCEGTQLEHWTPLANDPRGTELKAQLLHARSAEHAGDYADAERSARETVEGSSLDTYPRLHAEALFGLGHILDSDGRGREAFEVLDRARNAALASDYDQLFCETVAHQAKIAALIALDPETSTRDLGLATACVERTDPSSILIRADMLEAQGLLSVAAGAPEQAVHWHQLALELRRSQLGPESYEVGNSLHNLANALSRAERPEVAIVRMQEALRIRELNLGPTHPKVARVLFDLGRLQRDRHATAEARRALERARAIYARAHGGNVPQRANVHLLLGLLDRDEGEWTTATAHFTRARQLQDTPPSLGPHHPRRAQLLRAQGGLRAVQKDFEGGLEAFAQATLILRVHDPRSARVHDGTLSEIEMLRGLEDHAAITRRATREGEPLREYVAEMAASERGRFGWYIGDSSLQEGRHEQAAAYLRLALDAYAQLDKPAASAQLSDLLQRATQPTTTESRKQPWPASSTTKAQ